MQWFGKSWGAPICTTTEHVATPVGKICVNCEHEIAEQDSGFIVPFLPYPPTKFTDAFYHRDCFLNSIFGEGQMKDFVQGKKH